MGNNFTVVIFGGMLPNFTVPHSEGSAAGGGAAAGGRGLLAGEASSSLLPSMGKSRVTVFRSDPNVATLSLLT